MRLRLLLAFTFIVLVTITVVLVLARQNTASEVRAFMVHGGMVESQGLVDLLEEYYQAQGSWSGVEEVFRRGGYGMMGGPGAGGQGYGPGGMMGGPGMGGMGMMSQRLRLADAQSNLVFDSAGLPAEGRLTNAERNEALTLEVDGRTVGYLLPEGGVTFDRNAEARLLQRLNRTALTAALVAGGLSLVLAWLLAWSLLRPVHALAQAAQKLGSGDLSRRVVVRGNDELAQLGSEFNAMADSLEQSQNARRAMTADIAHELRTPLAVQRAHLEALQDGIYPLTPENLEPVLDQTLLLARLVEDLRTLALAESGGLELERTPTDLPGLVQRLVERFTPQAAAQNVALRLESNGQLPPLALDPMRIEQILGNLLSNALRYAPTGSEILLRVEQRGNQVLIQVRDQGPGLSPEALEHIFERFYRADRSRSRSEGGAGLGLAIARGLAEAHGGKLTAANHPEGGAVFTLELPLHSA